MWFGFDQLALWPIGVGIVFVYSPLCWVRTLEYFKKGFFVSIMIILFAVVSVTVYCFGVINKNAGEPGQGYTIFDANSYSTMIGFAFFMFEGAGCMMPILKETSRPDLFGKLVISSLIILCTIYILFASICYYAWGSSLTTPVVTEMLPAANKFVICLKLVFCLQLIFSYQITIVPVY